MSMCEALKRDRRRRGMTQSEYARWARASTTTICKLENDETAWRTMQVKTVDKIAACFEAPLDDNRVNRDRSNITEKAINEPQTFVIMADNVVKRHDEETLTLIEFAYEGLSESNTHDEFIANLKMLQRILSKY